MKPLKKSYLKYPITNLEDYSKHEKEKLLDAVIFTPKEEVFSIWKLLPSILLFIFVVLTIIILGGC